jgi:hypothetical protein
MKKRERAISFFLVMIFCLFAGYFWRMSQESRMKLEAYYAGKVAMIDAIRHEIPKGYIFYIDGIKFIPRKDRAVNITFPTVPMQVAGAGDQHRERLR